jgi:tRNA pseudouridine38-40 synthase
VTFVANSTLSGYKLPYYRATVAYDGTDFLGFQLQASGRTVQGALEAALLQLSGTETRVVGAGRTDAQVHAVGQVVGFRAEWRHTTTYLHRALNAVLPPDVAVVDLDEAPEEWHPRFSAKWRHYRYTVRNTAWRAPLTRRYALHIAQPLRLNDLQAAARVFVGEHDFASFGRPMQDRESTVRVIYRSGWRQEGDTLYYDVIGNAFLRGMVRSLVGSMLSVGLGQMTLEQLRETLAAKDRSLAAPPAAACGLCLAHVEYDDVPQGSACKRTCEG